MKKKNGFTLIEGIVILVIVASLAILFVSLRESGERRYSHEAYSAWSKLHQRTDFTFEEWKEARKAGLLDTPSEAVPVMVPMPIYSR